MEIARPIRVVLVDDHNLFRGGLRGLLDREEGFAVAGEATNGAEFLDLLETVACDVVLLDIDMPVMGGAEAARKALAKYPDIKIITLSMHGEEEYYFSMVSLGVKGFLLKNSSFGEVVEALSTVAAGGSYFSQELLTALVSILKRTEKEELLSARELEILLLICKGESNQEIADKLFISKRTVDKHRANILEKTGCRNTANLVAYAIKNSLVEL